MALQCKDVFQTLLRFSIQLLLLGLFVYFSGEPAIRQYLDKKVLVVKSRRDSKGTPAPAVTIVALNEETQSGWKEKGQFGSAGFVQTLCSDANTTNSFANCIQQKTYNKSELIRKVRIGSTFYNSPSEIGDQNWKEDFTHIYAGRIYTFDYDFKLKASSVSESALKISLYTNVKYEYEIYIHDPSFFYITRNEESGHPNLRIPINLERKGSFMFSIALTEVAELNVPDDPCNEDPNYNFRKCMKESFLRKVGCKTNWDGGILEDLPRCVTQEQFL